jgi:hypothetical protein
MNYSDASRSYIDHTTVNMIGWIAVLIFAVCLTIYIYRLQQSLISDIGGLKSVRNI